MSLLFGVNFQTMTLEFVKVVDQVERMGRYLGHRAQTMVDKLDIALDWFTAADDLDAVWERINAVRNSSVSGYRGAAPAPQPHDEVVSGVGTLPLTPKTAVIVAVDGSQIYPDPHGSALFYLINLGSLTYFYGRDRLPEPYTQPELIFIEDLLEDQDGRLINSQTVNTRRTIAEMQLLAKRAWALDQTMQAGTEENAPIFTIHDGNLLKFFSPTELVDAWQLETDYFRALQKLHESNAFAAGYIDRTSSSSVISLLHLLNLQPDEINDANLKTNGQIEGISDAQLFAAVLQPGERSAIFSQSSPQNKDYKDKYGAEYEIAFFYINVGDTRPHIVRIEIPMWVGRHKPVMDHLHALLVAQCAIQGRERYPYVLTRADELAYIKQTERQQLDELIRIELRRQQITPERSTKLESKGMARSSRRRYLLGT